MKKIRIIRPVGCWFPGDVAGFSDDFAATILAAGAGELVVDPAPVAEPAGDPPASRPASDAAATSDPAAVPSAVVTAPDVAAPSVVTKARRA